MDPMRYLLLFREITIKNKSKTEVDKKTCLKLHEFMKRVVIQFKSL